MNTLSCPFSGTRIKRTCCIFHQVHQGPALVPCLCHTAFEEALTLLPAVLVQLTAVLCQDRWDTRVLKTSLCSLMAPKCALFLTLPGHVRRLAQGWDLYHWHHRSDDPVSMVMAPKALFLSSIGELSVESSGFATDGSESTSSAPEGNRRERGLSCAPLSALPWR